MSLLLVRATLWSAILILLSLAALQDVRARIIPNRLVLAVMVVGLLTSLVERPTTLWLSLVLAFSLFIVLGVLAHYDIMGAGDVKMMAALTLTTPPEHITVLLFAIAMAGGALSSAYLVMRHLLTQRPNASATKATAYLRWLRKERSRIATGKSVPYGVAILAGTTAYFVSELY